VTRPSLREYAAVQRERYLAATRGHRASLSFGSSISGYVSSPLCRTSRSMVSEAVAIELHELATMKQRSYERAEGVLSCAFRVAVSA
jgi:hypothetical protein